MIYMKTLKNSRTQSFNLWWREQNLQLTKWCLLKYKETKDEYYYKQAEIFGEWSKLIKEKYYE